MARGMMIVVVAIITTKVIWIRIVVEVRVGVIICLGIGLNL
jgi:hypothetical protein